jgi:hypothetical protein
MTDITPDGQSAADEAGHLRAAARIRREHPGWVVIWVARTGRYHAYPLFRAPRGTALAAATPDELAAQMDQIQQAARWIQAMVNVPIMPFWACPGTGHR